MKNLVKKGACVVAAALLLAGCDSVKHGTIVEKNYPAIVAATRCLRTNTPSTRLETSTHRE